MLQIIGVNKWTWRNEGERCNPPIQFWGLNEPPGINGGDVERNCVAMEVLALSKVEPDVNHFL